MSNDTPDDDDIAALARSYTAEALTLLSNAMDNPNADPKVREEAKRELEKWLLKLKELRDDPQTPDDHRRDIEEQLRKLRQS